MGKKDKYIEPYDPLVNIMYGHEKNMKKYSILLIIVLSSILITSGCLDLSSGSESDLNYGGQYYPEEFVLKGGSEKFWGEYDLDVKHIMFQSAKEGNQALVSGEIDVVIGSDSKTVSLFSAIPDKAVIIGTSQKGDRYSTVVKEGSGYESWYDLKGEKVATKLGTGAEQVLLRYFDSKDDLDWDDFDWVNLDIKDMSAQLETGNIKAFTAWEPTPAISEAMGIGEIMMTYGFVAPVPVCLTTTKDYLENNRETIVKFIAAHMEKAEMIENDPDGAAELAADAASSLGSDVSKEAFLLIFDRIDFSIEFNQTVKDSVENTADFLLEKGKISEKPEIIWDDSIIEEAKSLREN